METVKVSRRIAYLDVAKGIGILLVVMAHNDLSLVSPYLHQWIYAFHMPLFFFLSGYFFKADLPFLAFFWKRFNTILKPFLFTILLIYVTSVSFSNMSFATALGRIVKSLYGTGHYIDWVQLWFLPSLFITSLFAYLFYRLVLSRIYSQALRWIVLLATLALGVYFLGVFYPFSITLLGKQYVLYGLPLNLDLALVSGFFYLMGNEVRRISLEKTFSNVWFLLGTGGSLILLTALLPQTIDFNIRLFESFPLNTLEAILGILFTMAMSKQIEMRTTQLSSGFQYIGQASLFILIFHVPIQEFWGKKVVFMTNMPVAGTVVGFVVSVALSLAFYKIFVERNPIALFVYGRKSALPKKDAGVSETE